MSSCVLIFRGHTMIFNNLMLYPSWAHFICPLGTHTGNGGCICVCTQQSVYSLGGRGEEEVLYQNNGPLPLGANSNRDGGKH